MMNLRKLNYSPLKPLVLSAALATAIGLAVSPGAYAGDHGEKTPGEKIGGAVDKWHGEARQAWLDGKVETALLLNRNLNSFEINTKTDNNIVTLFGEVNSEIESDLAEEIAAGVTGVEAVNNELEINQQAARSGNDNGEKSFSQHWNDATTTATIKSKLLLEDSVKGLDINVDTDRSVVTLTGEVASDAERDLVEAIARNTESVAAVNSDISVTN